MGFEHRWTWNNLSAYMDGELPPDDAARVEKHLKECADCQRELDSLCELTSLMRQMPSRTPPRSFFVPAEAANQRRRLRTRSWAYGAMRTVSVLATLLLVFVIGGDLLFFGGQGFLRAPVAPGVASLPEQAAVVETVVVEREAAVIEQPAAAPAEAATELVLEEPVSAVGGGREEPSPSALKVAEGMERAPDQAVAAVAPSSEQPVAAAAAPDDAGPTPEPQPEALALAPAQPTEAAVEPPVTLETEGAEEPDPVLARLRTIELVLVGVVIVLLIATLLLRRTFRRL